MRVVLLILFVSCPILNATLVTVAIGAPPFQKWVAEARPLQGMLVRKDRYHRQTLALARQGGVPIARDAVLLRLEARSYADLLASKRIWSWVVVLGANLLWLFVALFWISTSSR